MRTKLLIALFCCAFCTCKKEEAPATPAPPLPVIPEEECKKLPPPPEGFPWQDSLATPGKNVSAFFPNPLNGNEMIVVLQGDFPGSFKLVSVNLQTRQETFFAAIDEYLPSVNKEGWILFSGPDNNIYKIRTSGADLQQLTQTNGAHNPRWNGAGTHFFFIQDAQGSMGARLNLANSNGGTINNWPEDQTHIAPLHQSNRIIVQERTHATVTVYLRDLDSNTRLPLFSGPYDAEAESTPFRHLFASETDELLFWSNRHGIFSYEIATGFTDTLFKTCETVIYDRPMQGGLNEITCSRHTVSVLKPVYLLHHYKCTEYNHALKQTREVRIY